MKEILTIDQYIESIRGLVESKGLSIRRNASAIFIEKPEFANNRISTNEIRATAHVYGDKVDTIVGLDWWYYGFAGRQVSSYKVESVIAGLLRKIKQIKKEQEDRNNIHKTNIEKAKAYEEKFGVKLDVERLKWNDFMYISDNITIRFNRKELEVSDISINEELPWETVKKIIDLINNESKE